MKLMYFDDLQTNIIVLLYMYTNISNISSDEKRRFTKMFIKNLLFIWTRVFELFCILLYLR